MTNPNVKRTQKDYTLTFKLQVVQQIEQGQLSISQAALKYGIQGNQTIKNWLKKFGDFDWDNQLRKPMEMTPEQKIINQVVDIYNNFRSHDSNYLLTPSQMFATRNKKFKTYKKMVVN
ncbi:transposase [Myroides sp. LJL119]